MTKSYSGICRWCSQPLPVRSLEHLQTCAPSSRDSKVASPPHKDKANDDSVIGDGFFKHALNFYYATGKITEVEWEDRKRQHHAIQAVLFPNGLGRRLLSSDGGCSALPEVTAP